MYSVTMCEKTSKPQICCRILSKQEDFLLKMLTFRLVLVAKEFNVKKIDKNVKKPTKQYLSRYIYVE